MAKVEIYTRQFCPYCTRALSLLDKKGVKYTHVDAGMDPQKRQEMILSMHCRQAEVPASLNSGNPRVHLEGYWSEAEVSTAHCCWRGPEEYL